MFSSVLSTVRDANLSNALIKQQQNLAPGELSNTAGVKMVTAEKVSNRPLLVTLNSGRVVLALIHDSLIREVRFNVYSLAQLERVGLKISSDKLESTCCLT